MPCWEVQLMSVEFSAKSIASLREAAQRLGMDLWMGREDEVAQIRIPGSANMIQIDLLRGRAELDRADQHHLNALKRTYSEVVLEKVAAKKRWILKKQAANKFQMKRF